MSEKPKRNRSIYADFEHIERFHRRRMVFAAHVVVSLALQVAIWSNWYGSYYVRGLGFENNFFTDRIGFSVAFALFLIGHFIVMRLSESKDRMVVQALRHHADELLEEDISLDEPDVEVLAAPTQTTLPPFLRSEDASDDSPLPFDDLENLYRQANVKQRLR